MHGHLGVHGHLSFSPSNWLLFLSYPSWELAPPQPVVQASVWLLSSHRPLYAPLVSLGESPRTHIIFPSPPGRSHGTFAITLSCTISWTKQWLLNITPCFHSFYKPTSVEGTKGSFKNADTSDFPCLKLLGGFPLKWERKLQVLVLAFTARRNQSSAWLSTITSPAFTPGNNIPAPWAFCSSSSRTRGSRFRAFAIAVPCTWNVFPGTLAFFPLYLGFCSNISPS